tara:strand:+ start:5189 stop:5983 length:795 start_codon:yes stop_codon:yes gene_type:complete
MDDDKDFNKVLTNYADKMGFYFVHDSFKVERIRNKDLKNNSNDESYISGKITIKDKNDKEYYFIFNDQDESLLVTISEGEKERTDVRYTKGAKFFATECIKKNLDLRFRQEAKVMMNNDYNFYVEATDGGIVSVVIGPDSLKSESDRPPQYYRVSQKNGWKVSAMVYDYDKKQYDEESIVNQENISIKVLKYLPNEISKELKNQNKNILSFEINDFNNKKRILNVDSVGGLLEYRTKAKKLREKGNILDQKKTQKKGFFKSLFN